MRARYFALPILFATTALIAPTMSFAQVTVADAPVAQPPVANAPLAEAPVAQAPPAQAPAAQAPLAEAPVAPVPVAQPPVAEACMPAPPALPVYVQPPIPAQGYLWTPGYWGYAEAGYFWVPGTWVQPPAVGLLWTPGYWGWNGGTYAFSAGYWGAQVGFYGGINYGLGYFGDGYRGGRWTNGAFAYNSAVNNLGSAHFANVYSENVDGQGGTANRASYNGGAAGVAARPSAAQEAFGHAQHVAPTEAQAAHVRAASGDQGQLASVNHGRPAIAATSRPGEFRGAGAVEARGPTQVATARAPVAAQATAEHHDAAAHAPALRPALRNVSAARARSSPARHAAPAHAADVRRH